jgi:hypothetical protein
LATEAAVNAVNMEAVIERIAALERERRQLLWGAGAVLSILFVMMISQSHAISGRRTIVAENIVLKDAKGKTRAALSVGPDGSPSLSFLDEKGDAKVRLHSSDGQHSSLTFLEKQRVQVALSATSDGVASLQMFEKNNRGASGLYLWPDGSSGLGLQMGGQAIDLSARPNGKAGLSITGNDGSDRRFVGVEGAIDQSPGAAAAIPSPTPTPRTAEQTSL